MRYFKVKCFFMISTASSSLQSSDSAALLTAPVIAFVSSSVICCTLLNTYGAISSLGLSPYNGLPMRTSFAKLPRLLNR